MQKNDEMYLSNKRIRSLGVAKRATKASAPIPRALCYVSKHCVTYDLRRVRCSTTCIPTSTIRLRDQRQAVSPAAPIARRDEILFFRRWL